MSKFDRQSTLGSICAPLRKFAAFWRLRHRIGYGFIRVWLLFSTFPCCHVRCHDFNIILKSSNHTKIPPTVLTHKVALCNQSSQSAQQHWSMSKFSSSLAFVPHAEKLQMVPCCASIPGLTAQDLIPGLRGPDSQTFQRQPSWMMTIPAFPSRQGTIFIVSMLLPQWLCLRGWSNKAGKSCWNAYHL